MHKIRAGLSMLWFSPISCLLKVDIALLTASLNSTKPVCCRINCSISSESPPKETQLLSWFALMPDTFENCWKHLYRSALYLVSPLLNSGRSSAKLNCMMCCLWHLWLYFNIGFLLGGCNLLLSKVMFCAH